MTRAQAESHANEVARSSPPSNQFMEPTRMNKPASGEGRFYDHREKTTIIIRNEHGVYIGTYDVVWEELQEFLRKEGNSV